MCSMANEQAFNVKFVGEVEKFPELYNYNLPQYSRKDITEKTWVEVGKKMNMSAYECKERWKNLRAVFIRHLKPLPNGSGAKRRKPYYLMEAMKFTLPYVKTCKPAAPENESPLVEQSQCLIDIKVEPQCDKGIDKVKEKPPQLFPDQMSLLPPSLPQQPDYSSQQPFPVHSQQPLLSRPLTGQPQLFGLPKKNTGLKRRISAANDDTGMMDYLQKKVARHAALKEKDSKTAAIKSFLDSLVPELESLTEEQLKKFRRSIFRLIDDITGQSPLNSSDLSYQSSTSSHSFPSPIITLHETEKSILLEHNEDGSTPTSCESNSVVSVTASEEPD